MSEKKLGGLFAACAKCDKLDVCPIPGSRPQGVTVDNPDKCVLKQMPVPHLEAIANQLIIQSGMLDLEKIRTDNKLRIIQDALSKRARIITASPV